jgi:hypothetical protein
MQNYFMQEDEKKKELLIIHVIVYNNQYQPEITDTVQKKTITQRGEGWNTDKKKWVTFTYTEKEVPCITQLFSKANAGIAYKTKPHSEPSSKGIKNEQQTQISKYR